MRPASSSPDRRLPVLYLGFAHLCLAAALLAIAADPAGAAGFHYHPRMVAIVHLVTLGWIAASILGALYMLGPMTLRAPMTATRADRWAFWVFAVGTLGMVSHFWLDEPRGMVWSAAMVTLAFVAVGARSIAGLRASPLGAGAKIHLRLAFANLLLAASLGLLAGVDKFRDVLPGYVLDNVYAHAHLAALGFATMTVMGAGYRLLPMFLPAASPRGPALWASALLLEAGTLGLVAAWLLNRAWLAAAGLLCVGGIAVFVGRVLWMLRRRRRPHRELARPDWGTLQSLYALLCLLVAAALGLALAAGPAGAWRLTAVTVYGVFGLLGFLAQIVLGIGARLLPQYAWLTGRGGGCAGAEPAPRPSPYALAARPGRAVIFAAWLIGVPALAAGLAVEATELLRWAALLLCLGTAVSAFEQYRVLRLLRGSVL